MGINFTGIPRRCKGGVKCAVRNDIILSARENHGKRARDRPPAAGEEGAMLTERDVRRLREETVDHLVNLIKIDTTNPPGNETRACEYIRDVLMAEGIESEILESAPGRGSIIARLEGDGTKKPFLMAGHLDVVPANADDWSADPFGGEIRDGCVWGRGAMDMKHNVAIDLVAFLELKRRGAALKRDVIFCAAADEEQSGLYGVGWLVENHFDKLKCEYAINEGGGLGIDFDGTTVYLCQNAEKGVNWLKVVTRGDPGHGSVPKENNAVVSMAEVIREAAKPLPVRKTQIVETMIRDLSKAAKFPKNIAFRQVLNPLFTDLLVSVVRTQDRQLSEMISAMLRDTVSPTIVKAGYKENVIPEKCEAVLDCRILPGITSKEFVSMMKKKLSGAEVERIELPVPDPTESPLDTELFRAIHNLISRKDPGALIAPILMPGATDNRFLRIRGITAYGFCPLRSKTHSIKELSERIHGIDERVPIDALEFGATATYELLEDFCC